MAGFERGDRVRLVRCTDEWTRLPAGLEGTVGLVDDAGTVHVDWDNGSHLGMVFDAGDEIVLIAKGDAGGEAVRPAG